MNKKPLKKVYVEITNICNLSCDFCSRSNLPSRNMSVVDFGKIARELQDYTDYLHLHVKGEPLMHPNLDQILEISHAQGYKINLTTNGTLLQSSLELLKNAPALRQVNISLHAQVADKGAYICDMIGVGKALSQCGVYVCYRLWDGESSDNIKTVLYQAFPNNYEKGGRITLDNNIFLSLDSLWQWPDISHPIISEVGSCHGLRHQLGILTDGTVVPCCLDGEGRASLGNILTNNFYDIWHKSVMPHRSEMQRMHLSLRLCKGCGYREKFNVKY